jgi:hypothetical protein
MDDDNKLPALPYKTLDIPEALVVEMAKGLVEPKELAEAYGFSGVLWDRLQGYEPFLRAVTLMQTKLEQEGFTFRMQSQGMADLMAKEVFRQAMQPEVPLGQKIEVLKTFARYADLEPKTGSFGQAGPGTSINIILGDNKTLSVGGPVEQAIDVIAKEVSPEFEFSLPVPDFIKTEPVSTLAIDV